MITNHFIYRIFETLDSFSYVSRGWINKIYNNYYGRIIIVNDSLQKDITFKFIDKRVSERLLADLTEIQKMINGFRKSILN